MNRNLPRHVLGHARVSAVAASVIAVLALGACGKQGSDATVGQRVDGAVADAKSAAQEAKQASKEAAGAVADTAKDVAITAQVKTALAGDPKLSAMSIDVDTKGGRVTLSGTAPDAGSRDRATTLASAVDGVAGVDNRLTVQGKS